MPNRRGRGRLRHHHLAPLTWLRGEAGQRRYLRDRRTDDFELPFDLIVMARTYPPIPPDPALYRALFFMPLFLIEITTLLLLRLSPMVRLTRATFFSFAVMLGVFAVWALSGFGYPSARSPPR